MIKVVPPAQTMVESQESNWMGKTDLAQEAENVPSMYTPLPFGGRPTVFTQVAQYCLHLNIV